MRPSDLKYLLSAFIDYFGSPDIKPTKFSTDSVAISASEVLGLPFLIYVMRTTYKSRLPHRAVGIKGIKGDRDYKVPNLK